MRYSQAKMLEIIWLVEGSDPVHRFAVKQMLEELEVPGSVFYAWYRRYRDEGYDNLANRHYHESLDNMTPVLCTSGEQRRYNLDERRLDDKDLT